MPITAAVGLLPLAKLLAEGMAGRLGANPIAEGLDRLGFWALTWLALALVPTPARRLLGVGWPVRIRRTLGLLAFAYAALHFAWYLGVDRFFDWSGVVVDLGKRPFITVGFLALVLLTPLAITSTDRWVRRLGYRRWAWLHRLVYPAAALGAIHFWWRVKADHRRPALFAVTFGLLLAARVPGWLRGGRRPALAQAAMGAPAQKRSTVARSTSRSKGLGR